MDALSGDNLLQSLLTGQLTENIRCLNRETVIALGKLRKIRDTRGESIHLLIRVDALIRNVQVRTRYRLVRVRLVIARLPRPHRKELRNTGQQATAIVLLTRVRKIRAVDTNHVEPTRLQRTRRNRHLRAEIVIAETRTVMQAVARQRNNMGENRASHNLSRSRVCLIQSDVRLAVVSTYDIRGKNMVSLNRQSRILPRLINRRNAVAVRRLVRLRVAHRGQGNSCRATRIIVRRIGVRLRLIGRVVSQYHVEEGTLRNRHPLLRNIKSERDTPVRIIVGLTLSTEAGNLAAVLRLRKGIAVIWLKVILTALHNAELIQRVLRAELGTQRRGGHRDSTALRTVEGARGEPHANRVVRFLILRRGGRGQRGRGIRQPNWCSNRKIMNL